MMYNEEINFSTKCDKYERLRFAHEKNRDGFWSGCRIDWHHSGSIVFA